MPSLFSRVLLAIEMLLLAVPVMPPFFTVAYGSLVTSVGHTRTIESFCYLVWSILIGLFLFAAYRVAFAFIHKGPAALATIHKVWWLLCFCGAAYSTLLITLLTTQYGLALNLDFAVEYSSVFGLLYLVPLTHVLLERKFRRALPQAA